MRTQLILVSSAVFLGVLALFLLFAPVESLSFLLLGYGSLLPSLPAQLLSAPLLGLSALNWLSRGSTVGGIYGRPLLIANLIHFIVGSLVLLRPMVFLRLAAFAPWVLFGLYVVFAVLFALLLLRKPAAS
jgi:hypothetical protein